jgi:tetratricopeptide (TPR) repeat protein
MRGDFMLRLDSFLLATLLGFVVIGTGCHKSAPLPQSVPNPQISETASRGDEWFQRGHLYGWRKAEDYYARAAAISPNPVLREKLLLTRVLLLARCLDEDVPAPDLEQKVAAACAMPVGARAGWLCSFINKYSAPIEVAKEPVPPEDPGKTLLPDLKPGEEALGSYLRILYSQAFRLELPKDFVQTESGKFGDSPLFQYHNLRRIAAKGTDALEKERPDFAELFLLLAERRLQAERYRESRAYATKVLELVPEYTRAINALGTIQLYVLEEFSAALQHFESSLRYDPTSTGGLFGRGVVLHHIGSSEQSNRTFDVLLGTDLSRRGRFDTSNVRYYRGMARYYQAYNHFRMFHPEQARSLIDTAKQDAPNSEQVNYLSGVLYFNANKAEEARQDFHRVLAISTSNCDAYNYLGLIYIDQDETKAINYFLGMCSCASTAIRTFERQMASVPKLDLDPSDQENLRSKLQQKIAEARKTASDQITNAITLVDLAKDEKKDLYIKLMRETLQKISSPDQKAAER